MKELNMTTLEERRDQLNMAQTFQIIRGYDGAKKINGSIWPPLVL
jgi:hypothetical protein